MTGVTSKCSYASRAPVLFTHGFVAAACALPGWIGTAVGDSTSVAEGAMLDLELASESLVYVDEQFVILFSERESWIS